MKQCICFLIVVMIATSCVINKKGSISSSVNISSSNFKYVKTCEGQSSAFYFLGFGGFDSNGLFASAKSDMKANAGLRGSQAIANITYDELYKYLYPLIYEHNVYVTGDVIEFIDSNNRNQISDSVKIYSKIDLNNGIKEYNGIKVGDIVLFEKDGVEIDGKLTDIINGFAIIDYQINNSIKTTDRQLNKIKKK